MYWYSCSGSGLVSNGSGIAGNSGTVGHFKQARDLSFWRGVISCPSPSPLAASGTVGISMTVVRVLSNATVTLEAMHLSWFRRYRDGCRVGHYSPRRHAHDELKTLLSNVLSTLIENISQTSMFLVTRDGTAEEISDEGACDAVAFALLFKGTFWTRVLCLFSCTDSTRRFPSSLVHMRLQ